MGCYCGRRRRNALKHCPGAAAGGKSSSNYSFHRYNVEGSFLNARDSACSDAWMSWPSMHETELADEHVFVFTIIPAVGNLFLHLDKMIAVSRALSLALVLDTRFFPAFRETFDAAEVRWDQDFLPFYHHALSIEQGVPDDRGLHSIRFEDGFMLMGTSQLVTLASMMKIHVVNETSIGDEIVRQLPRFRLRDLTSELYETVKALTRTQPCTWNKLLRRSAAFMTAMENASPFDDPRMYGAWHVRTAEGEAKSHNFYDNRIHGYVIEEPSSEVCPVFIENTKEAKHACRGSFNDDLPIFISSTSVEIKRNCTTYDTAFDLTFVDIGVTSVDVHTFGSPDEKAPLNAFLDFMFLIDAAYIIRSASSFSGTVASMKGVKCRRPKRRIPGRVVEICAPETCFRR